LSLKHARALLSHIGFDAAFLGTLSPWQLQSLLIQQAVANTRASGEDDDEEAA
jgi:hypothetical protein